MVVNDLDLFGIGTGPHKAEPELVVDPDRIAPRAVPAERFKPVGRRASQIGQGTGFAEHYQFSPGWPDQVRRKPFAWAVALENRFGANVLETPDHSKPLNISITA
jgi:hypothetical protein